MKKLLLIAAMAALALGASADGYKIEQVWNLQNPQAVTGLDRLEIRQGFGMDGKFYVNSKKLVLDTIDGVPTVTTAPVIYEIDQNGLTGVTFPGGKNCGISRDEAGNIILSLTQFPNTWSEGLRVINPKTGEYIELEIPEEAAIMGRCDFLSFAKGNLMEDGEIWLTGANQGSSFSHIAVAGGEVDADNSYYMVGDGLQTSASVVINPYTDINGEDALLYWSRNGNPEKLLYADDQFTRTTLNLANHANTNGMFPLVWDGKEFFIYSTKDGSTHYLDGFAIAESGGEPIVDIPKTTSNNNGFQSQWLNAEIDEDGVTIYQYFPGNADGHFTVWRLTKDEPAPEVPNVYMLGGDDQPWSPASGQQLEYDAENNVYTGTFNFPAEFNYFSFTTELAENNDDGGWAYILPFRFGLVSNGDFLYGDNQAGWPLSLTYEDGQALSIAGGEYTLKVDLENMKLYIEKVGVEPKRGDANGDGDVNITDVIVLINAILSSDFSTIYLRNADVDFNLDHNISDAIKTINFVSTGIW